MQKNQNSFRKMMNKFIFLFVLLFITHFAFSQEKDSIKSIYNFGGNITLTNNGISLLPTFSLGEPAVIFEMKVGGRLSFEPQFRFSLEAQPWSFIFWWRYKIFNTEKFRLNVGAHPALLFSSSTSEIDGNQENVLEARRYLASEISPNYMLTKNISVGMYYLYSHGLDAGGTKNVNFITLNSRISNINLSKQIYLTVHPQLYYLKMDQRDGFYVTSSFALAKRNFPLSLHSIINKTIKTDILGSKDFVWNVSLIYSFNKEYTRK